MSSLNAMRRTRNDRNRFAAYVDHLRQLSAADPIAQAPRGASAAPTIRLEDWIGRTRTMTLSAPLTARPWYGRRLAALSTRLPSSQGTFMPFGNHFVAAMHVFEAYSLAGTLLSVAYERRQEDDLVEEPSARKDAKSDQTIGELEDYVTFCRRILDELVLSGERSSLGKAALLERLGDEVAIDMEKLFACKQASIYQALLPVELGNSPDPARATGDDSSYRHKLAEGVKQIQEQHTRSSKCCRDETEKARFSQLCDEVSEALHAQAEQGFSAWEMPTRLWRVTDHLWLTHARLQTTLESLRVKLKTGELDRADLVRAISFLGQYDAFDESDEARTTFLNHTAHLAGTLKLLAETEIHHRALIRELKPDDVTAERSEVDEQLTKQIVPKLDSLVADMQRESGNTVVRR